MAAGQAPLNTFEHAQLLRHSMAALDNACALHSLAQQFLCDVIARLSALAPRAALTSVMGTPGQRAERAALLPPQRTRSWRGLLGRKSASVLHVDLLTPHAAAERVTRVRSGEGCVMAMT
jgi:hypothetical protein